MRILALMISLSVSQAALAADAFPVRWIGVDLRDLAQYGADQMPQAQAIFEQIQAQTKETLYSVALSGAPVSNDQGLLFRVVSVVLPESDAPLIRFWSVQMTGEQAHALNAGEVALAQASVKIEAAILERKVLLEDPSLGLRLVYPMAAGGLDPGLTENSDGHWTLMTPVFHQAHLTRRNAYAARTNPSYYRGLPFMRVMRQGNEWTEFAFHTRLAREIERPETFRGFNSHGCLHLRDRDLQEMYLLLSRGGLSEIPLNVLWSIPAESFDTPFPSWDSSYQKVANCAASGQDAHSCEDPDTGLTKMFEKPGAPPFDRLVPVNGDHL